MWFSSLNGISKFINKKFKSYPYNPILNNEYLLDVNTFLHSSDGKIWVGTNSNGLYSLNYNDLSVIKHYTLDLNDKYSVSRGTCLLYTSPSPRDRG